MTKIALSFASFLKLTDEEKRELQFGALIHDIGKLHIPVHILTKRGKLSEEEFAQMKNIHYSVYKYYNITMFHLKFLILFYTTMNDGMEMDIHITKRREHPFSRSSRGVS